MNGYGGLTLDEFLDACQVPHRNRRYMTPGDIVGEAVRLSNEDRHAPYLKRAADDIIRQYYKGDYNACTDQQAA